MAVALPAGAHGIRSGSTVQVDIVLSEARDALVVLASAVHDGTDRWYVVVLRAGQETHEPVSVGIVGASM